MTPILTALDGCMPHQAGVTWAWCLACGACTLYCARSMERAAARLMLLYFQPVVPPIFMLWLWARNVRCFESYQVSACF